MSMTKWTVGDWQNAIAANNRDKGWRDKLPPSDPRELAQFVIAQLGLIVSEVGEAIDAVRLGQFAPSVDHVSGKPEGVPSELADIIIRTIDLGDMLGINVPRALEEKHSYNLGRAHRHGGKLL